MAAVLFERELSVRSQSTPCNRVWLALIAASSLAGLVGTAHAQRADTPMAVAPPNHAQLSRTINGWIYVPMALKQKYDDAMARLETLQKEVVEGHLTASEAQAELAELKRNLDAIRKELKGAEVLVTGPDLHEQTETFEFDLGPDRLLAISANEVRIVGWDGPKVKCELQKSVLSFGDKDANLHLQAIRIQHQRGRAEFAGQTEAEQDQSEQEYLVGAGAKLTDEQRARRRQFLRAIRESRAIYQPYLSKDVDQLTIAGLDYESNQWLVFGVDSKGGDGNVGGARQRYGVLTVHVPRCAGVAVLGAMRGLVVEGLNAPLIITQEGSSDSNIQGEFAVRGLIGSLNAQEFPLGTISSVTGHVSLTLTSEFGFKGAGLRHSDNQRRAGPPRALPLLIDGVSDGIDLKLGHIDAELKDIGGRLNVTNEFGATRLLTYKPLADTSHRIVSQGGRIDVEFTPESWSSLPVIAVTSHGGYGTNISREEFEDFHLTGNLEHNSTLRSLNGFRTVKKDEDSFAVFEIIGRIDRTLLNAEHTPGLYLISRGGAVTVLRK